MQLLLSVEVRELLHNQAIPAARKLDLILATEEEAGGDKVPAHRAALVWGEEEWLLLVEAELSHEVFTLLEHKLDNFLRLSIWSSYLASVPIFARLRRRYRGKCSGQSKAKHCASQEKRLGKRRPMLSSAATGRSLTLGMQGPVELNTMCASQTARLLCSARKS